MIFGYRTEDWVDIYRLAVFRGVEVKSLSDLYKWWVPARTPNDCVLIAFDLSEAREKIPVEECYKMIEELLKTRYGA